MGRLLVLILIVVFIVWALKRALRDPRGRADGAPQGEPMPDLVRCAHCGVNLPKGEARSAGGRYYCSEEHWRLGPRDG